MERGGVSRHMDINQCAEYTGLSVPTIRKKISNREIPHGKVGGKLVFDRFEIDAWISSKRRVYVEHI